VSDSFAARPSTPHFDPDEKFPYSWLLQFLRTRNNTGSNQRRLPALGVDCPGRPGMKKGVLQDRLATMPEPPRPWWRPPARKEARPRNRRKLPPIPYPFFSPLKRLDIKLSLRRVCGFFPPGSWTPTVSCLFVFVKSSWKFEVSLPF